MSLPFCIFHNIDNHNTNECQELRALRDGCLGRRPKHDDCGFGHGGGYSGVRRDNHDPRQAWRDQSHADH